MKLMVKKLFLVAALFTLFSSNAAYSNELETQLFRGVVTYYLVPAKVMRINNIVENPKPGTSYIGNAGILVEIDENIEVMANWTVVEVEYYEYKNPKVISYKLLEDEYQVAVKYHAVSVDIDGDLSQYIGE